MSRPVTFRPTTQVPVAARAEAVQPSLWDRLVDDLPGLVQETEARRTELSAMLGPERVDRLLADGLRGIEREPGLDDDQRRALIALSAQAARRAGLERSGILVTAEVLREAVRRDVEELFGIERLASRLTLTPAERAGIRESAEDLADFPEVRRSVLNFGVPAFSGRRVSDFDLDALARELRDVLAAYEPRLRRDSLQVTVAPGERMGLRVRIEGVLMLVPVPERLRLATLIDLDSGRSVTAIEEG